MTWKFNCAVSLDSFGTKVALLYSCETKNLRDWADERVEPKLRERAGEAGDNRNVGFGKDMLGNRLGVSRVHADHGVV